MQPQKKNRRSNLVVALFVVVGLSVPCCGIVSAIAIPSFIGYMRRAKTAEAESNLSLLYSGAAAYYVEEHRAPDGSVRVGCTVASARTSNVPGPEKTVLLETAPSFDALGFLPADPVLYQYEIVSAPGCDHPAGTEVYTFRAHGDLDGDGVQSLFELTATSGPDGDLQRTPLTRQDETE